MRDWQTRRKAKQQRMRSVAPFLDGVVVDSDRAVDALQALLRPGDRIGLEGDNQKQADFLARSLAAVDPTVVHDLHLLISSVSLPEHLDVFEKGICRRIDFAYAGPQSFRMAQLIADGTVEVGAIHTYVELYARMFVDLIPMAGGRLSGKYSRNGSEPVDTRRGALMGGPTEEDWVVIDALETVAAEADASPAAVALAWVRSRPGVASTLSAPARSISSAPTWSRWTSR